MKKILMIGTGGTIASEMTPEGLTPELNTHQLLAYLPRIAQLCHVDCIQLYSLDSTSIHPTHWLGTAQAIREHYDDYDGFVISHGTDTMAYTAAALSYLVQDSPKPIILTGAQKPIWFDGTDSKRNLTDAFLYACRGCGGVQIVFNGKVILGTRARKTFSKSFQAFSSVNYPDLAVLQDERLLQYIRTESLPRPVFYDKLCENVGLLKLIPGTRRELVDFMMERYDGIVVESDQSHYVWGTPYFLLPEIASHAITTPLTDGGYRVLLPISQGLTVAEDLRDTLSVTKLLTTSASAFAKAAGYDLTTYEKEEGDVNGPFALAVAISDTVDDGITSDIVWVSSAALVDDQTNTQVSGGNQDFFLNALGYLCQAEQSSLSIHAKSLSSDTLTMDSAAVSALTVAVVGVIPAAVITLGIVIWIRRKRR